MKIALVRVASCMFILSVCGCNENAGPKILRVKDDLEKMLNAKSTSYQAGIGGKRGRDAIESDQEACVWIIPKTEDPNVFHEKVVESVTTLLHNKGAEVVSSGQGAAHGYVKESLRLGGGISTWTIIYRYNGGIGFVDVVQAYYSAEEESGRIGLNNLFIPRIPARD